jgi:hypothetical protein
MCLQPCQALLKCCYDAAQTIIYLLDIRMGPSVKQVFVVHKPLVSRNRLTISPSLCYFTPARYSALFAEVAQLVEQRPEKPRVRSSILRLGTISPTTHQTETAKACKLSNCSSFIIRLSHSGNCWIK